MALMKAARAMMMSSEKQDAIALRKPPVHSHASNGAAEVAVKIVKGVGRTLLPYASATYRVPIKLKSTLVPWTVRFAAFLYTRFRILNTGRTECKQLKMNRYMFRCGFRARRMCVGEDLRTAKFQSSTLAPLWQEGL